MIRTPIICHYLEVAVEVCVCVWQDTANTLVRFLNKQKRLLFVKLVVSEYTNDNLAIHQNISEALHG